MDGIIKPQLSAGGPQRIDIGQVMSNLTQNDLYFEMTLYAIVEVLKGKLDKDGKPILTTDELEAKAKECLDKVRSASNIATPSVSGLVLPK